MSSVSFPLVVGHRGAPSLAPGNTVASFQAAVAAGADMVELDVRRTRDGEVVVHHDAHLADGRPIADLARLDLPTEVPTLAEAVEACGSLLVNVEVKDYQGEPDHDPDASLARVTVEELGAMGVLDRILVSSFWAPTVAAIRTWDGAPPTGLLVLDVGDPERTVATAAGHGHRSLHPHDRQTTPALVELAHGAGLAVMVWTVNEPDRMDELASWGVDGIITDHPDVLAARRPA